MATKQYPIPQDKIGESFVWREWFQKLSNRVFGSISSQDSTAVFITGGVIDGVSIGANTPSTGAFTTLKSSSLETSSITNVSSIARNTTTSGAVVAVPGSLTLATGGVTLSSQTASAGSCWRVRAYGTYVAASSANARALTMSCFWGGTALTAITTANVLSLTAQTTNWIVEFEIQTTSTVDAWVTGYLNANVGVAVGSALLTVTAAPASTTVTASLQTLDFRVGQTGTVTTTDTINVQQVVIERLE